MGDDIAGIKTVKDKNRFFQSCRRFLGKMPGVRFFYDAFCDWRRTGFRKVVVAEIQGSRMYIDKRDQALSKVLLRDGIYEDVTTELFKASVRPGMTVVDIGANIGYFALIAARQTGDRGKVYAFEPEPHNYKLLEKNIRVNHRANVIPVRKAVSNRVGTAHLFTDKRDFGRHSLSADTNIQRGGRICAETTTLDGFFERTGGACVDIIKIDVEGAEGLVMEGAEKILKNSACKIFMEFFPKALRNAGTDPLGLIHSMRGRGYKIRAVIDEIRKWRRDEDPSDEEWRGIIDMLEHASCGEAVNVVWER